MTPTSCAWIGTFVFAVSGATSAGADDKVSEVLGAPGRSTEVAASFGVMRSPAELARADSRPVTGALAGIELGRRLSPHWMVGLYGMYGQFASRDDAPNARVIAGGAQGQYHFTPTRAVDPWLGLGAGYRGLFTDGSNRELPARANHGFDFARVRIGVDARASRDLALGPVLGLDLSVFTLARTQSSELQPISDGRVVPFLFAGFGGHANL